MTCMKSASNKAAKSSLVWSLILTPKRPDSMVTPWRSLVFQAGMFHTVFIHKIPVTQKQAKKLSFLERRLPRPCFHFQGIAVDCRKYLILFLCKWSMGPLIDATIPMREWKVYVTLECFFDKNHKRISNLAFLLRANLTALSMSTPHTLNIQ